MKLATLKNGSRDGQLVVVSRDLTRYTDASFLVPTLQAALDNWDRVSPHLEAMAESLEHGSVPSLRFHENDAESPLPRAYQWGDGAGIFDSPRGPAHADDVLTAHVAAIVNDVAADASAADAASAIVLLMLAATSKHQRPVFSPVAVTPDELGSFVKGGSITAAINVDVGKKPIGSFQISVDFAATVAAAARNPLGAGAIVIGPAAGEVRLSGAGVRIEMKDKSGHSIFGAIEQTVGQPEADEG